MAVRMVPGVAGVADHLDDEPSLDQLSGQRVEGVFGDGEG